MDHTKTHTHDSHGACSCAGTHSHHSCDVHGDIPASAPAVQAAECGCGHEHHDHHENGHGDDTGDADPEPLRARPAAFSVDVECGCSSCAAKQAPAKPASFSADIECGCGSCSHDHDHDHAHSHDEADAHAGHNHGDTSHVKQTTIKLIISGALFAAGFLVPEGWPKIACYLAAYLVAGYRHILSALRNIVKLRPFDETLLMTIATVGAIALGDFAEAAAVMILFTLGNLFEDLAVGRSKRNIEELMNLQSDTATLIGPDGATRVVAPEAVSIGQRVLVKPYERFPLDGTVFNGEGYADTSALTGESLPVSLAKGSGVFAGTINGNTPLEVEVTASCADSTAAKITRLAQDAIKHKATSERFITKFARYYTPAVVGLALLVALIPPLVSAVPFASSLYTALTLLVISCPCALVISVPLSFVAGIGRGSKLGILFKGSSSLESLAKAAGIAFDKTGTLTVGELIVKDIAAQGDSGENEVVAVAAALESVSPHPIARAIVSYANGNAIDVSEATDHAERPGLGVEATVNGARAAAGNRKLMAEHGVEISGDAGGATDVYVALGGRYLGRIALGDTIKPGAAKTVAALKKRGFKTLMLTGDAEAPAAAIAAATGVDAYRSSLLPGDKVDEMLAFKQSLGGPAVFVGDGVNDAPVISAADIGFAMGGLGSDAAIEAADVVLMTDEPEKIVTAIDCAKRTRQIATQNIVFVLAVKAAIMLVSLLWIPSMWLAIVADVGTSLLAVLNASRIFRWKGTTL